MPALDALAPRLRAAHTLACGISVDSRFSHAAWGASVGGVSIPLLADFHPKGAVAQSFGMYLEDAGMTARATVLIDADGVVRYASVADGQRDMAALVERCEALDAAHPTRLPAVPTPPGLQGEATLFVRDDCIFSRNAGYARTNLHLTDRVALVNVSHDPQGAARLEALGGKRQAPALALGSSVTYESKDIVSLLVGASAHP